MGRSTCRTRHALSEMAITVFMSCLDLSTVNFCGRISNPMDTALMDDETFTMLSPKWR
jgi:hypothetical protein